MSKNLELVAFEASKNPLADTAVHLELASFFLYVINCREKIEKNVKI